MLELFQFFSAAAAVDDNDADDGGLMVFL